MHVHIYIYVYIYISDRCMYTYIDIYLGTCRYIYIYVYIHAPAVYTVPCTHPCLDVYVHVYLFAAKVNAYTCLYVLCVTIYVYTHTYTLECQSWNKPAPGPRWPSLQLSTDMPSICSRRRPRAKRVGGVFVIDPPTPLFPQSAVYYI